MIVGIALEVGIEPTVRHAIDLGYIPVAVADACGSRDKVAARRALDSLAFAGGSLQTDMKTICALFNREPLIGRRERTMLKEPLGAWLAVLALPLPATGLSGVEAPRT